MRNRRIRATLLLLSLLAAAVLAIFGRHVWLRISHRRVLESSAPLWDKRESVLWLASRGYAEAVDDLLRLQYEDAVVSFIDDGSLRSFESISPSDERDSDGDWALELLEACLHEVATRDYLDDFVARHEMDEDNLIELLMDDLARLRVDDDAFLGFVLAVTDLGRMSGSVDVQWMNASVKAAAVRTLAHFGDRGIPRLVGLIRDENASHYVGSEAVDTLARVEPSRALWIVAKGMIQDGSLHPSTRFQLLITLSRFEEAGILARSEAVEILEKLLRAERKLLRESCPDDTCRLRETSEIFEAALELLIDRSGDGGVQRWKAWIRDPQPIVAAAVVEYVAVLGPAVAPMLAELLLDSRAEVVSAADRALERLGPGAKSALPVLEELRADLVTSIDLVFLISDEIDDRFLERVVRAYERTDDQDLSILASLVAVLEGVADRGRPLLPIFERAALCSDADARRLGRHAIARVDPRHPALSRSLALDGETDSEAVSRMISSLPEMLSDLRVEESSGHRGGQLFELPSVFTYARAHSLVGGGAAAIDKLVGLVGDSPASDCWIALILGRHGPVATRTVPLLQGMLASDDPSVRANAAQALGRIGPEALGSLDALRELAVTDQTIAARFARQAIERLTGDYRPIHDRRVWIPQRFAEWVDW